MADAAAVLSDFDSVSFDFTASTSVASGVVNLDAFVFDTGDTEAETRESIVVSYAGATAGTAPADADTYRENGYLFAGWFTDEKCETSLAEGTSSTSAYAKYVDIEVLGVKAQISGNLLDEKTDNDATGDLRFITTVDSLKYKAVGFYLQMNGTNEAQVGSDKVYSTLYAIGATKESKPLTYTPNIAFSKQSIYFKTYTITGFADTQFSEKVTATPYWITLDGTVVRGRAVEKSISQGLQ